MAATTYETSPGSRGDEMIRRTQEVQMLLPSVEQVPHRHFFHADVNPQWLTIAQADTELPRPEMPADNKVFELHLSALNTPTVLAVPNKSSGTTRLLVTSHEAWAREAQRRALPSISVNMLTWEQLRSAHTDAHILFDSLIQATSGLVSWEVPTVIHSKREMLTSLLQALSQSELR